MQPSLAIINKLHIGVEGGWDSITAENAARRLYISGSSHIMVLGIDTANAVRHPMATMENAPRRSV